MAGRDLVEGKATLPVLLVAQADQALRSEIEMYIQSDRAVREARAEDFAAQLVSHQVFDDVCEMVDGSSDGASDSEEPRRFVPSENGFFKALGPGSAPRQRCPRGGIIDDEAPPRYRLRVLAEAWLDYGLRSRCLAVSKVVVSVTVVEPRPTKMTELSVLEYEVPSTPAIIARWSKWRVQASGRSHTASPTRCRYVLYTWRAFYQHAIARTRARQEVTLVTSTTAHRVQASTDNQTLRVITNHETLTPRVVCGRRPSGLLIERSRFSSIFRAGI